MRWRQHLESSKIAAPFLGRTDGSRGILLGLMCAAAPFGFYFRTLGTTSTVVL